MSEKKAKKRGEVVVEHEKDGAWVMSAAPFDSVGAGKAWIAKEGRDGQSYRVVTVWTVASVAAEAMTKRTLTWS